MVKPLNRIAVAFWVSAALLAAGQLAGTVMHRSMAAQGDELIYNLWVHLAWVLSTCGPLLGFGTVIELLDEIRWNALPPEQRKRP